MKTITIKDETATGKILHELTLQVANELITVKDIIEARVKAEVEEYNRKAPEKFNGLVQPSEVEQRLNIDRNKRNFKPVDAEKQLYIALQAFQQNGFFVLVDDVQADELDEEVLVTDHTSISFIKLTPLVGG
ncbi:hypothetical protein V6R21_21380 [Limibacter armeniacum]|uniref:hypothetical protein n=1 Tax=Limibacter armeniacum TaxID=466084 RepID=UPI002FE50DA6